MTESKTALVINAIINKENMAEVQSYLGKIMPVFEKMEANQLVAIKPLKN